MKVGAQVSHNNVNQLPRKREQQILCEQRKGADAVVKLPLRSNSKGLYSPIPTYTDQIDLDL
jgi:hypothetical protein